MPAKRKGASTPHASDVDAILDKDPKTTGEAGGSIEPPTLSDVLLLQESIDELLIRAEAAARSAAVSAAEASEAAQTASTARASVRTYAGQVKGYTARAEQALEQVVALAQAANVAARTAGLRVEACAAHAVVCQDTARSLVSEVSDVLEHPALRRVVGAALERAARRLGILPEAHTPPPRRRRRFAPGRITEEG